jgi:hypothetical protein
MNTKHKVLNKILEISDENKNYIFHNDLVKDISRELGFGNPFDVTKIDDRNKLPDIYKKRDLAIIHLGSGNHKIVKGIKNLYHSFEPIQIEIDWEYKKSILNQFNSSESNILSVANNQRILHHFLFDKDEEFNDIDISKRPKTYFPHRTKTNLDYYLKKTHLKLTSIQIEIDLTIEYKGKVGIFEAKNGNQDNFSIYQLYHPFLYYHNFKESDLKGKLNEINCVYVVRNKVDDNDVIKLWAYTFAIPNELTSLKFLKSSSYKLKNKV